MKTALGAIFDWDGVVVDSSHIHLKSWEKLAEELDHPLPNDHFERGFGKRNQTIIPDILGWTKNLELMKSGGSKKKKSIGKLLLRKVYLGQRIQTIPRKSSPETLSLCHWHIHRTKECGTCH